MEDVIELLLDATSDRLDELKNLEEEMELHGKVAEAVYVLRHYQERSKYLQLSYFEAMDTRFNTYVNAINKEGYDVSGLLEMSVIIAHNQRKIIEELILNGNDKSNIQLTLNGLTKECNEVVSIVLNRVLEYSKSIPYPTHPEDMVNDFVNDIREILDYENFDEIIDDRDYMYKFLEEAIEVIARMIFNIGNTRVISRKYKAVNQSKPLMLHMLKEMKKA